MEPAFMVNMDPLRIRFLVKGIDYQKLKKFTAETNYNFLIKNCINLFIGLQKDV
jgi:hypothetical protein